MFMIDLGAESLYSKLGLSPDATQAQIVEARDAIDIKLTDERRKADASNDLEERKKIEARQAKIHAAFEELARPDKRKEYDKENTHLRFFLPQSAAVAMFMEKADRIYVLHRVISEFLAAKGEKLLPLSDIDRVDFTADETPIDLLDNLLK
jgi:curved DNA-binding protein CbpA